MSVTPPRETVETNGAYAPFDWGALGGAGGGIDERVEFFPGTTEPVPLLLTPLETARLLRLDVLTRPDGTLKEREPADAIKSLDHLVARTGLQPRRFGKSKTFVRDEVFDLIRRGGVPHKQDGGNGGA